jgi:hypothetical protein
MMYNKFWEELIAFYPLTRHGPHRKRKKYGANQTHSEKSDLISFLTKIRGDTQTDKAIS